MIMPTPNPPSSCGCPSIGNSEKKDSNAASTSSKESKAEQFFMRIQVGEAQREQDRYKSVDVIAVLCENARLAGEHQQVHLQNQVLLNGRTIWKNYATELLGRLKAFYAQTCHLVEGLETSRQIWRRQTNQKDVIIQQQLCEIEKLRNEVSELSIKLKNHEDTRTV